MLPRNDSFQMNRNLSGIQLQVETYSNFHSILLYKKIAILLQIFSCDFCETAEEPGALWLIRYSFKQK